jgi:hypothetical protein
MNKETVQLLNKLRGEIPLAFMVAWADVLGRTGGEGRGIFKLLPSSVQAWNQAFPHQPVKWEQASNPKINIAIAAYRLRHMISIWHKYLPTALSHKWSDPNYVDWVVLGTACRWGSAKGLLPGLLRLQKAGLTGRKVNPYSYDQADAAYPDGCQPTPVQVEFAKAVTEKYLKIKHSLISVSGVVEIGKKSSEGHPYDRQFDALFEKYADGEVPVDYLRTLSYSESRLNPNDVTTSSNAVGLFQVVYVVLKDWNKANGTNYTAADLKDPDLNSKIGVSLIRRIVQSYKKNHPKTLSPNWDDRRYVELLTMGFNAGYSEGGGVGRLVGLMEKDGMAPEAITADAVVAKAKSDDLPPNLTKSARYIAQRGTAYPKAVATRYFAERGITPADRATSSWTEKSAMVKAESSSSGNGKWWLVGIGAVGIGSWLMWGRKAA